MDEMMKEALKVIRQWNKHETELFRNQVVEQIMIMGTVEFKRWWSTLVKAGLELSVDDIEIEESQSSIG